MYLTTEIISQLIEWTKEEYPNEAAGYLFKDNSIFKKIVTEDHSGAHFFDNNLSQLLEWIEKWGSPSAIFHSHPGAATPSGVDYHYMQTTIPFFGCVWIIMSRDLKLRAWSLSNRRFIELGITVL